MYIKEVVELEGHAYAIPTVHTYTRTQYTFTNYLICTTRGPETGYKDKHDTVPAHKKSTVWKGEEKANRNLSMDQNLS